MQDAAKVLAKSYPQARINNLSNTDNDTVTDTENLKNSISKTVSVTEVHHIARTLTEKLNSPENFAMYCGFAWKLPQATIWNNLEIVLERKAKGKCYNPAAYFTRLCKG